MRVQRPRSRKDRDLVDAIWPGIEGSVRAGMASVEPLIRAEVERLAATDETPVAAVDSASSRSS
jgi:hypothetical protein